MREAALRRLTLSEVLVQTLRMSWLWCIFAGFYLVAYAFWVPGLFGSGLLAALLILVAVGLGGSLLYDGFSNALALQTGRRGGGLALPFGRARVALGGAVLLAFVDVYLPPSGRIVAHWPLDLAITVVSGLVLLYYAVTGPPT